MNKWETTTRGRYLAAAHKILKCQKLKKKKRFAYSKKTILFFKQPHLHLKTCEMATRKEILFEFNQKVGAI